MTIQERLRRSNIIMLVIPILIAGILLILGFGGAIVLLESVYLPRMGLTLHELHNMGEELEPMFQGLKFCVLLYAAIVLVALLATVVFTNLYLTRNLFAHIQKPLDALMQGVKRIEDGDLDSPIAYEEQDEFRMACDAVDAMAVRLKKSLTEQQREQQRKQELIAGMSHDLKSPLTTIRAYTEALLEGVAPDEPTRQRYLQTIYARETDLEALVNRLFELAKLGASEYPMHLKALPLQETLHHILNACDHEGISVDCDAVIDCTVLADRELLQRVLNNLVDNSRKYGANALSFGSVCEEDTVTLWMEDNGPGVPEEQLPCLFEPFYRGDAARTKPGAGSGLGLAVVKKSMQQMGGNVRAENAPGGGLRIVMQLPMAKEGNMELKRILIVEDDADIAAIERDYLELGGYAVTIAPDGTTGLDAALHQPFDLILLDVMLPGIDGFAICKQVRAEKDIPILMVTARGEDVDKIRGLGFGADDYIEKPFSPSVLVARVKAHLAQYARLKPCADTPKTITVGPLTADPAARRITKNGVEVPLKNKEYELLFFLMRHPEQVFSREDLYELIWGLESMGDNITVAVHINRLREKIEDTPADPKLLQTVWGVGYRLHVV